MSLTTGSNPCIGPVGQPDRYQVISVIGQGGQARVYKVSEPLGTDGAAGTAALRAEPLTTADRASEEAFARFGQMLTNLSHHGIARVRDVFFAAAPHPHGAWAPGYRTTDPADAAFPVLKCTVQDYIEGDTLSSWLGDHPEARLSTRLGQLLNPAAALDDVHAGRFTKAPVAHGDIKPSNIMVPADGSAAVLVDFGLARLVTGPRTRGYTPGFNAPELAQDPTPTVATDRYAFAATTAQVLLGRPLPLTPDSGALDVDTLERQLASSPLTQYRPELCAAVIAALRAPAHQRPASLAQWITTLRGDLSASTVSSSDPIDRPTPSMPPTQRNAPQAHSTTRTARTPLLAGLLAAVLVLAVAGWALGAVPGPARPWVASPSADSGTPTPSLTPSPSSSPTASTPDPTPSTDAATPATPSPTAASPTPVASTPAGDGGTPAELTSYLDDYDKECKVGGSIQSRGPANINGTLYAHTISQTPNGYAGTGFYLARLGQRFLATIGPTDNALPGHTMQFELKTETGASLFRSRVLAIGQTQSVNVKVSGVLKLFLVTTSVHPRGGQGVAGWGDARVISTTPLRCP